MSSEPDQLTLVPEGARRRTAKQAARTLSSKPEAGVPVAEREPIAHVRIDTPVPHLDRIFDYLVPARLDEQVVYGVRVRVRFAGKLIDGIVVGRAAESQVHSGLRPLERVISPIPVLLPSIGDLVEATCDRYAGTFWDVLRVAVPPRHARAESASAEASDRPGVSGLERELPQPSPQAWSHFTGGPETLARLARGELVRFSWTSRPGNAWTRDIADLALSSLANGPVLIVVPDRRSIDACISELRDSGVEASRVSTLAADSGPERRYREFLRVLGGGADVIIGTRSAVFAPVSNPSLVIVWDDGDDQMVDAHAPYWHALDVAAMRSHASACSLAVGGYVRTTSVQQLCESRWLRSVTPTRIAIKEGGPVIRAIESADERNDPAAASARIPHLAWQVAKEALRTGPVLVQVAQRGYLPALSCQGCREAARCECGGPLSSARSGAVPHCRWCGRLAASWVCPHCSGTRLRALSIGLDRTREEFGRAFPDVTVRWSTGDQPLRMIDRTPAVVVATPGVEPIVPGGYAAVLLLDARSMLQRPFLRASEEALNRWLAAAALAAPGAHVVVTAENSTPTVQALVRWDAAWFARRELAERTAAHLPPSVRMISLRGDSADIEQIDQDLSVEHSLLGPQESGRALLVIPRREGTAASRALRALTATRSAHRSSHRGSGTVTITCDPRELDL